MLPLWTGNVLVSVGGPEGHAELKPEGEAQETPETGVSGFVALREPSGSVRVGGPEGLAEPRPEGPSLPLWARKTGLSVGGPEGHAELKPEGMAL